MNVHHSLDKSIDCYKKMSDKKNANAFQLTLDVFLK